MYFTFTCKKEIFIEANCPAGKVSQAIRDNIENKDGIFGKAPQKPFCGEEINGLFSLGLNDRYFFKHEPFERFSCEVRDDGKKCMLHLVFKSLDFFIYIIMFLAVVVYILFLAKGEARIVAIVFSIIPLIRSFSFNIKINKCMDEIEYIIDKVNL